MVDLGLRFRLSRHVSALRMRRIGVLCGQQRNTVAQGSADGAGPRPDEFGRSGVDSCAYESPRSSLRFA